MSKKLFVILLFVLVGSVRSEIIDPHLNLLTNGDFSSGLAGWNLFEDIPITVNAVSSPYNAAHFTSLAPNNQVGALQQNITLQNLAWFHLSFYLHINVGGIGLQIPNSELTEILPNGNLGTSHNCTTNGFCGAVLTESRWYNFRVIALPVKPPDLTYISQLQFFTLFHSNTYDIDIYLSDVSFRCLSCLTPPTQVPTTATPHPLATQPPIGGDGTTNAVPGVCIGNNCIDPNSSGISDRICADGLCGSQGVNAPQFPNLVVPTPRGDGSGGSGGTSGGYVNQELAETFVDALTLAEIDVSLRGINGLAIDESIFDDLSIGNTTWIGYIKGFFEGQGLGAFQPLFTLLMVVLLAMMFINLIEWVLTPISTVTGLILKIYRLIRSFIPFA
jgi:hypothetical protein